MGTVENQEKRQEDERPVNEGLNPELPSAAPQGRKQNEAEGRPADDPAFYSVANGSVDLYFVNL